MSKNNLENTSGKPLTEEQAKSLGVERGLHFERILTPEELDKLFNDGKGIEYKDFSIPLTKVSI